GCPPHTEIRLVIQTGQIRSPETRNILHRLPWHWWDVFGEHHTLEFTLNFTDMPSSSYQPETTPPLGRLRRVRILSILGSSQDIDVQGDQKRIEELRTKGASPVFLTQPKRDQLTQLWDEPWDILCFSGHSDSDQEGQTGWLAINSQDKISIEELRNALRTARNQGLQLVIFNSCNGLGLAQALATINLPYLVVWREPVPDRVAQKFLDYFLQSLAIDKPLYTAMREAREKLQLNEERDLSRVTGLPAIVQNSPEAPRTWKQIRRTGGRIGGANWSVATRESRQEAENRQILLNKVNNSWIRKVLEHSLQSQLRIELGLEERFNAIALSCHMAWETSDQHKRPLPLGTRVIDKFDELGTGRTLLILGEPGSGKTTMLLELARDLLADAQEDGTLPIPVVLNLSSWGSNPRIKTLADWLVGELNKNYQVPQSQGNTWVKHQKLLLLLDGLDEVKAEQRELCLKAINHFIQAHGRTEIVVCSRIQDYNALSEKLCLQAAIYLQPLTSEQIYSYFEQAGDELAALRTVWHDDDTLQELAINPLMLNIMSSAYQGKSVNDLPEMNSLEDRRQHLFDTYIVKMLERRGGSRMYSKERSLHWLTVLAQKMLQESQTVFFIERLQPTWLHTNTQLLINRIGVKLLAGLVCGLTAALHFSTQVTSDLQSLLLLVMPGVIAGAISGLLSMIIPGFVSGLLFALLVALIVWHRVLQEIPNLMTLLSPLLIDGIIFGIFLSLISSDIRVVDTIKWSWAKAKKYSLIALEFGLIYVIVRFLLARQYYVEHGFHFIALELLIAFILAGLVGGLSRGDTIDKNSIPNQGIWSSAINIGILFTIFVPIGMICGWIYAEKQYEAISIGLSVGILTALVGGQFSGLVLIQHFSLRVILWWNRYIPWNYAQFLDYAAERIFLNKVGGGYIFTHRLLLEHFASLPLNGRVSQ
ncbi:MAG: NACHT domain-containing protein, partial [Coleofasciculus sp. S288]|nr:NACHT domain-containing protein [Coleofasciculus sp. S288]